MRGRSCLNAPIATETCEQHRPRSTLCGRRELLLGAAVATCAILLGTDARAAPPKETGLSFEGLLKDKPGFQPRTPAPLPITEIPGFLSKEQLGRNFAAYRDAFAKLLAAESALVTVSRDAAHAKEYEALRAQQVNSANSVLLHEFYFRNLATSPVRASRYVLSNMTEHMGTVDSWREDFTACARVAQSWTVLVYDPYDDRWHNLPLGESDAGGWIGSNPLIVCDVSNDAWSTDYKDRNQYVTRFFDHIDWDVVGTRYHQVDRH